MMATNYHGQSGHHGNDTYSPFSQEEHVQGTPDHHYHADKDPIDQGYAASQDYHANENQEEDEQEEGEENLAETVKQVEEEQKEHEEEEHKPQTAEIPPEFLSQTRDQPPETKKTDDSMRAVEELVDLIAKEDKKKEVIDLDKKEIAQIK